MLVYVESNFILEITLGQEEAAHAGAILEYARAGRLTLVVPSFAFSETFTTVTKRRLERLDLGQRIDAQVTQLRRSPAHVLDQGRLRHVSAVLAEISSRQIDRLNQTVQSILAVCERVDLNETIFAEALRYRPLYGFSSTQDAVIYASVIAHARAQPLPAAKCFITRNPSDFERDPRIRSELRALNCELKGRFAAGAGYLRGLLAADGTTEATLLPSDD